MEQDTHHLIRLLSAETYVLRERDLFQKIEMARKEMNESLEQKQLIQWCKTDPRLQFLFHIPNESIGGQAWIIHNRQMGVKKGVPDLMLPIPSGKYHGLFIEMKTGTGRLAEDQKKWIKALNELGYLAVVAYGWEDARDKILDYLKGL